MGSLARALAAITVATTLALVLIYLVPMALNRVHYSTAYRPTSSVLLSSKVPGTIHITKYSGDELEFNVSVTYSPLIYKPRVYYAVNVSNGTTYIDLYSVSCPKYQLYPIYTCIVSINVYVPSSVLNVTFSDSASIIDVNASDLRYFKASLFASQALIRLYNISKAELSLGASQATINIYGKGNYGLLFRSSEITVRAPTSCIEVSASLSDVTYPGGSIDGSGASKIVSLDCISNLIVNATSSVINISR
jgi:hypothetical protein